MGLFSKVDMQYVLCVGQMAGAYQMSPKIFPLYKISQDFIKRPGPASLVLGQGFIGKL